MEEAGEIIIRETIQNPFCEYERALALKEGWAIFEFRVRDCEIMLNNIRIPKDDTGQGRGTEALEWVKTVAERTGYIITAIIEPNGHRTLDYKKLAAWYKRHGFTLKGNAITYIPQVVYK